MVICLYLVYLGIVSIVTKAALGVVGNLRGTGPREERKLIGVLIVIGASIWSVIFEIKEAPENVPMEVSSVSDGIAILAGLFLINIAGLLPLLSFIGLMGLPLFVNSNRLMQLYELKDDRKMLELLGISLLFSNVGISGGLLVLEYLQYLKGVGSL